MQYLLASVFVLSATIIANCQAGEKYKLCDPPKKGFQWKCPCPAKDDLTRKYAKEQKIEVTSVVATQGSEPINDNGGMDLTKPVIMKFGIRKKTNFTISKHLFDFKMYQFRDELDGKGCQWVYLDTYGATDDIDACPIVDGNCNYAGNRNQVISTVDWQAMFGEMLAALKKGAWYAFEIFERDGNTPLNCVWTAARVIRVQ